MLITFLSLAKGSIDHGSHHIDATLPPPMKLDFDLNSDVTEAIKVAEKKFVELISKEDLKVVNFEGYGKALIKKLQVSPDAFAQMAIQLAYYKMYGVCKPTYESAQTRKVSA
jgi:carnitine O-acetyltransferase